MKKDQISIFYFGSATALLLLPLIAMQFTSEVKWEALDFIIAGILLFGTATTLDYIQRKIKPLKKVLLLSGAVLLLLFLIWAELAVGIFGSPIAGS